MENSYFQLFVASDSANNSILIDLLKHVVSIHGRTFHSFHYFQRQIINARDANRIIQGWNHFYFNLFIVDCTIFILCPAAVYISLWEI